MARDRAVTEKEMAVPDTHPTEDELVALASGQVMPRERRRLVEHLDGCAACRGLLAALSEEEDETPADALADRVIAGHRIERFIAKGGMGAVYVARPVNGGAQVALKVMLPDTEGDLKQPARMRAEVRTLMSVDNDHVVKVIGFAELDDGRPCVIMEYLEGEPLHVRLKRKSPGLGAALGWIDQLLDGLIACHSQGVIHRDLKPSNVLVLDTPRGPLIKLIDFGLAKQRDATNITSPRSLVGSAGFLAPELLTGASASVATDLYSLGCVAWRILTGNTVFPAAGTNAIEVLRRHAKETPPRLRTVLPGAPAGLDVWIDFLLARNPGDRFGSGKAARASLDEVRREFDSTVIEKTPMRGRALVEDSDTQLERPATQRPTRDDRPALKKK
ncbi:MAG: protein kinase [Archangium sp.]